MSRVYCMAEKTNEFDVVGLHEQIKELDRIMASDPAMEKAIQDIIRTALKDARSELSGQASSGLGMKADPRQAYRAIKSTVYRQVLGGSLSLFNKRRAGTPHDTWIPSVHTGRGGNRRTRSGRTVALQSYWGSDRGFILRFLNQGTTDRKIKFKSNPKRNEWPSVSKWSKNPNSGKRGKISPRPWFGNASYSQMQQAAAAITGRIEELITKRFNAPS